jgi:hypothetical protein
LAVKLNDAVADVLNEDQIFWIDQYLGNALGGGWKWTGEFGRRFGGSDFCDAGIYIWFGYSAGRDAVRYALREVQRAGGLPDMSFSAAAANRSRPLDGRSTLGSPAGSSA